MTVYYNEFDANAAQWLRNLGAAGSGNAIIPSLAAEFISAFMESVA